MTERNIYADNYSCSFSDPSEFLDFLKERQDNSRWMVTPSRDIVFESLEKDTPMGDLYLKLYEHEGRAEIIADTMENTNLLLKVNGETYPVRSCAIKTILERARISGHALNKVSKKVFTRILNYCMDVAAGESLIKVADEKVSAVHGGDPKDYAVLEILPLVQCVQTVLDSGRADQGTVGYLPCCGCGKRHPQCLFHAPWPSIHDLRCWGQRSKPLSDPSERRQ